MVSEELESDKSTQDVVAAVTPPVETRTILIRVRSAGSKVLIYGRPIPEAETAEVLTLRNNLNLCVLKTAETHLKESVRKDSPLDLSVSDVPLSHLRQLAVRSLSLRAEKQQRLPSKTHLMKWHMNQMQLWLLNERPHQEVQELLEKVEERIQGARDYLADSTQLRKDRGKLKIYLSTLEELCLVLEREQETKPRQFSWTSQQKQRLFNPKDLSKLVEKGLEGKVDGVNEQSKAVRLLLLLLSDLSGEDQQIPIKALKELLNGKEGGVLARSKVSLKQSLRLIRVLNLVWWNRSLRKQVGASLKKHVKSKHVFKMEKEKKGGLGKRGQIDKQEKSEDPQEVKNEKKKMKKIWKAMDIEIDSEMFQKVKD